MRPSPHAGHFSTHSEIGKPELAEFIPSLLCLGCDPDEGRESRRASHSGLPRGMRCRTGSVQFDLWSSTASQSSALQRQPATGWPVEWRAERRHAQVMAQGKERRPLRALLMRSNSTSAGCCMSFPGGAFLRSFSPRAFARHDTAPSRKGGAVWFAADKASPNAAFVVKQVPS